MSPRRLLAVFATAALLGTAACSDDTTLPPDRPGAADGVTFTSAFARTPTSLTWTYTLRNDGPADVAVFNGGSADTDDGDPDTTGAWVVPRDDDTVEVSQRLFSPPENVGLARANSQWGTVLPPGVTLAGSATVPLPLRVAHPYGAAFEPPLKLSENAGEVVFCVGTAPLTTIPPMPSPSVLASPDGSAPAGARARFVHSGGDRQRLACAPTVQRDAR